MRWAERRDDEWAVITDVHGAAGTSGWWQLVPGHALRGPWEAVELARVPAGGISGVHRHTRTHEVYFVLSGLAEFLLDDEAYEMPAGFASITARGQRHGLRATGDAGVVWLVAEVPAALPAPDPDKEAGVNPMVGPVDLQQRGVLSLAGAGVSPLDEIGLGQLAEGESYDVDTEPGEVFLYLMEGSVLVRGGGTERVAGAGVGVTFGWRERGRVTATGPARFFWVRSIVDRTRL
jgi:quercetin dioxygenase-like cupin family protein